MLEPRHEALDPSPAAIDIAALLYPELAALAVEIVDQIREQIPEYAVPLGGASSAPIRNGIEEGLHQLLAHFIIGTPIENRNAEFYRRLGRGEFREGRSLDALQAAYRISARVTWRHFAQAGHKAGVSPRLMYLLADNVFAFTEEMAALSVSAFTELRDLTTSAFEQSRQRLLRLLLTEPAQAVRTRLADLSLTARWPLPDSVACVAISEDYDASRMISPALDADILADLQHPDPCLLIPHAPSPARFHNLRRAFRGVEFALGPTVPLEDAAHSLALARQTLALKSQGVLSDEEHIRSEDHLATMHLLRDDAIMRVLYRRALAPFGELKKEQRDRLCETLLAWISTGGSVMEVAALLRIHPQTVRYRMRRIEEIFPDRLNDPDWRFEMQLALRARQLTLHCRRRKQSQTSGRRRPNTASPRPAR
ncbi:PucR family transcriptional regulator [Actinomadura opuntiae]|uniref:PucR family transcriptional regulator n=1 Tax=Actinomadura sp. OS1-43 TaxID=604315 RepID=UPI00255ABE8B|nr:PucR family transcriptional regulator [Actinomadura sp. OS1-43]MDL4816559.1 helix-turn-helix domain-containing protein [Actinomadura sp. OS1-43]